MIDKKTVILCGTTEQLKVAVFPIIYKIPCFF